MGGTGAGGLRAGAASAQVTGEGGCAGTQRGCWDLGCPGPGGWQRAGAAEGSGGAGVHDQKPRGCRGGRRVGEGAHTAGAERGLSPGMSGAGVGSLCRQPGCPMWGVGGAARTHGGDVEGRGGPARGPQGRTSQLCRAASQAMSPVPGVRDVTSPGHATHAGDTRSVPRLGSQQDGSFTDCARDRQRPGLVPLPSPLCPPRRDTPSRLTFSGQPSAAGSGHQPGGAVTGTLQPGMGRSEFQQLWAQWGWDSLSRQDGAPVVPGRGTGWFCCLWGGWMAGLSGGALPGSSRLFQR